MEKKDVVMIDFYTKVNDTQGKVIEQDEVLEIIQSEKYKLHTDVLRYELQGDDKKDERRTYKTGNLPLVTFGGTFNAPRSKKTLLNHSGQASIDFDEYDKCKSDLLFNKLKNDPYVHILFRSPSYGLKVIYKIPLIKSDEEYKEYFYGLINYYRKLSPSQDTGCSDISRLCFLSYDPGLYINKDSLVFNKKGIKETKSFEGSIKKEESIPSYCPFIENIAAIQTLPSGEKSRHAYLDGNVYKYCKHNNKKEVFVKYKLAQGRTNSAFNGSDNFSFSCGTLRNYMNGNKENGFIQEGLKLCNECEEYQKYKNNSKEIRLPGKGNLISDFAKKIGDFFRDKDIFYFKPYEHNIVEIRKIKEDENSEEFLGFHKVEGNRFITAFEKHLIPGIMVLNKKTQEYSFVSKSMNNGVAIVVLESETFQSRLPIIKRIFTVPMPILYEGNLSFPQIGYDGRFYSWLPNDSPSIVNTNMDLDTAKKIITFIFKEFPFQEKQDYMNAIAGLLTPFLRGLYSKFNIRTPVFFYIANRERAGKDYCAGITGVLYEGCALEEPPISGSMSKNVNGEEELRKKLLSAFMQGRKRLHFANNKGHINNSIFEQVTTATVYSDRVLGKNEVIKVDNELEFSLSGNIGVSYTADFANRCRFVRLLFEKENANEREFKNPDLHGWVLNNRSIILSAMYSLVNNWVNLGMPDGKVMFASFPEWAKICGGIMESAGFDSPCANNDLSFKIGGDNESDNMKLLYELVYQFYPEQKISKKDIKNLILSEEGEGIFQYLDFNVKADQITFGLIIEKFVNRVMSGIKLLSDNNVRTARRKYVFTKEHSESDIKKIFGDDVDTIDMFKYGKNGDSSDTIDILQFEKSGNDGNDGNDFATLNEKKKKNINIIGSTDLITIITNITTQDTVAQQLNTQHLVCFDDIATATSIPELELQQILLKMKEKGLVLNPKSDQWILV